MVSEGPIARLLAALLRLFGSGESQRRPLERRQPARPRPASFPEGPRRRHADRSGAEPAAPGVAPPPAARAFDPRAARAKLVGAFNASQPVSDRYELSGRKSELDRLLNHVFERHAHAVIHGPRGSGKTSLARIFGDIADEAGCVALYNSASGDTDFATLMLPYLPDIPRHMLRKDDGEAEGTLGPEFGPRDLASLLSEIRGGRLFLIVDEFDRIENRTTKENIAAFMKLLSDMRLPVQLLLVGIAGNVDDLIAGHPSLRRHLVSMAVCPIDDAAVLKLIAEGSVRSGISFSDEARGLIVEVARGSPYHVRLFCLNSGMAAIKRGEQRVGWEAMREGLGEAFVEWAAMSLPAATAVNRLCERKDPGALQAAKAAAILAARSHHFTEADLARELAQLPDPPADSAQSARANLELLQPLLLFDAAHGEYGFEDALAPQFLLLRLLLRDRLGTISLEAQGGSR